jgi:hypothetical protein
MHSIKNEPKDPESLWLKFGKVAAAVIGLGRLLLDAVKLFIER